MKITGETFQVMRTELHNALEKVRTDLEKERQSYTASEDKRTKELQEHLDKTLEQMQRHIHLETIGTIRACCKADEEKHDKHVVIITQRIDGNAKKLASMEHDIERVASQIIELQETAQEHTKAGVSWIWGNFNKIMHRANEIQHSLKVNEMHVNDMLQMHVNEMHVNEMHEIQHNLDRYNEMINEMKHRVDDLEGQGSHNHGFMCDLKEEINAINTRSEQEQQKKYADWDTMGEDIRFDKRLS